MSHRKSYKLSAAKGGNHPKQSAPKHTKRVGVGSESYGMHAVKASPQAWHTSPPAVTSPAGHSKLHKRRT